MKLKRLILLGLGILTLASCTFQKKLDYQGAGEISAPFVSSEPISSEPTTAQSTSVSIEVEESTPVSSEPTKKYENTYQGAGEIPEPIVPSTKPIEVEESTSETELIFNDSISEKTFISYKCEGFYDLQILNQDYSLVYQCLIPYGGDMVTIEDSWKQLPHYSEFEYYSDGIHPGGTYKFDYYKFPVNNEYALLKVRGSTDETHSWNLKYVSSIEFLSGDKVNLENSYLDYNGEYSNCIDYQCLNGNQIEGGSNKVIETDYGNCETFKIIIDGWIK